MHDNRPPIQQQPQQLLTPDDVAALLGVTRLFVIKKAAQGKLPGLKLGKAWRFRASTIDSWLCEQERGLRRDLLRAIRRSRSYQPIAGNVRYRMSGSNVPEG